MIRIQLAFPENGWSYLTVHDEQQTVRCRISYLSDGMGDLIRALHRTLIGGEAAVAELQGEGFQSLVVLHTNGICRNDPIELCVLSGLVERHVDESGADLSDRQSAFFIAPRTTFGMEAVKAIEAMLIGHSYTDYFNAWACPPHNEDIHDLNDGDAQARWQRMRFPEREFEELQHRYSDTTDL